MSGRGARIRTRARRGRLIFGLTLDEDNRAAIGALGPVPRHPAVPRPAGAVVRREVGGRRSDPRDAAGAGPTWTTRGEHGSTYNYQLTGSIVSDSDQQRAVPAGRPAAPPIFASER